MWVSLIQVGRYAQWHRSVATRTEAERRAGNTKLVPPPLPINHVMHLCVMLMLLLLSGWFLVAIPFIALLFLFFPVPFSAFILLPGVAIYLPRHAIKKVAGCFQGKNNGGPLIKVP